MTEQNQDERKQQEELRATKRDLGTAGGGPIPNPVAPQPTKTITDENRENDESSTRASGPDVNTIDPHAQSSIGGRHPAQPQTAMGDQDAAKGSRYPGEETGDPMTSRAPDKLKQQESK